MGRTDTGATGSSAPTTPWQRTASGVHRIDRRRCGSLGWELASHAYADTFQAALTCELSLPFAAASGAPAPISVSWSVLFGHASKPSTGAADCQMPSAACRLPRSLRGVACGT